MHLATLGVALTLALPLAAQGEEAFLAFRPDADQAFAEAVREHKRVLVYQDWPG